MTTPATNPLLLDRDGRALSQAWNARTLAFEPIHGDSNALFTAPRITHFVDSTTNLGASATFEGVARTTQTGTIIVARAFAAQAGTLFIDQRQPGGTWRSAVGHTVAVAAGETRQLEVRRVAAEWRVRYVNGAAAQTGFELISSIT